MCRTYGYARISSKKQSIDRQIRNIKAEYSEAIIYQEEFTGTKLEGRRKFESLLRIVKAGDTIVFDSVSRMSRNAEEGSLICVKSAVLNPAVLGVTDWNRELQMRSPIGLSPNSNKKKYRAGSEINIAVVIRITLLCILYFWT